MRPYLILALSLFALSSCKPDDRNVDTSLKTTPNGRFEVTVVGTFDDDLAYNQYRSVYVLIDKKTGREFVGISGVGIAETGQHSTGKTSTTDER